MSLSTHVLDTTKGKPAAGLEVSLYYLSGEEWKFLKNDNTSTDGRCNKITLKDVNDSPVGTYKLVFQTGKHYASQDISTFYPYVEIVFCVSSDTEHYHVPLLLSPFGYSTYRGS